jgi:subtilisin family serine protease
MKRHQPSKSFCVASVALCAACLATAAWGRGAVELHEGHEVVSGEVLVKFRDAATATLAAQEMGREVEAEDDEEIGDRRTRRIRSRVYDTATLLALTARRADVEYAEPNYIVHAYQLLPADPGFGLLWGMSNTGQSVMNVAGALGADIGATQAWGTTTGSRQNVVAVIDTGIDYAHPDLAANVWSAPSAFTVNIGGVNISCPAGSHGFDAITNSCDPMDDNGHGTHVSGTIGAASNSVGVVGVNWNASLMGMKFLNAAGSGTVADAVKAIEFAIQVKNIFGLSGGNVRVLSNSWGGGAFSQALSDAIAKAYANDMLFVAAAGNAWSNNDMTASYPSNYPNVVAVAATDNNDMLPFWSNYGANTVALGAPGVNIYSTWRGQYLYLSGTSMAAPHVSGVAALVLSAPVCGSLGVAGLRDVLLNNTVPLPSLAGKTITGGRLSAERAVANCAALQPPSQPPSPPPVADFSLVASPLSLSVKRGQPASFTVTTAVTSGTPGPVGLAVAGLPKGASASFKPQILAAGASSKMTVKTNKKNPIGIYTLTIKGTGGTQSHAATVSLTVK